MATDDIENMKLLVLALAITGLMGCASYSTVTNEKDAWIVRQRHGSDQNLYFCRGNPSKSDGSASPICYEARQFSGDGNERHD